MGAAGRRVTAESQQATIVNLDHHQKAFVEFQSGCAVLHAPVGTGKTLVLAERAAEAIRRDTEPSRILCVTFTNRAAEELRQRIILNCGRGGSQVVVRTFHSLCAWMLRCEAKQIGLYADFVIVDDDDSMEIIRACANRLGIQLRKTMYEDEAGDACNAIMDAKVNVADADLGSTSGIKLDRLFAGLPAARRRIAHAYQEELASYHALDFADLVLGARAMLCARREIRRRWADRFSMIQVDEMQDTHMSEYRVLRALAEVSRNLALVGDFDQTIYEWRGSRPDRIIERFRRDFPEARLFSLAVNYRTTRTLAQAARCVVSHYNGGAGHGATSFDTCKWAEEGGPIVVHFAGDAVDEARWIASQLNNMRHEAQRRKAHLSLGRIGVLTRTNTRGSVISAELAKAGVPHLTVEQYEFFRRQEVKDAIAYLKYLANPADSRSVRRMLRRPARNIGDRTIAQVQKAEEIGLGLADMANPSTMRWGEPFGQILRELENGSVVVFDTETTGLNPAEDEIVEIAAVRLHKGQPVAKLHRYIRNSKPVGQSEAIHGLSDRFLADKGAPPLQALEHFLAFSEDALLVGHNVCFDLRMLRAHCMRLGLLFETRDYCDTLELAQRFVDTDDRSLEGLARLFKLPFEPTHHAMDDVNATAALLMKLMPLARQHTDDRMRVVRDAGRWFAPLAADLAQLRKLAEKVRPPQLLDAALDRSGLRKYYAAEPARIANLYELATVFADRDDPALDPITSLESILQFAALARNVDRIDPKGELVRVLTVHQSKGLEFDTVFVAGLSQHEFPSYPSIKEGREPEELRVFYVALTRARERLFLTGHAQNNGKYREPSPYFSYIGDGWVETGSAIVSRRYPRR